MLNLFDHLTDTDNNKISNYIKTYGAGKDDYIGNEIFLRHWAREKKTLFHLLGGKLIYKVPFSYTRDKFEIDNAISAAFRKEGYYTKIAEMLLALNNSKLRADNILSLDDALDLGEIITNFRNNPDGEVRLRVKVKIGDKPTLQIQKGMPNIRALIKIINYFDELSAYKDDVEKMRITISQVLNDRVISGNLCISIHPLDFLTMSDNDFGWSSCMSWTRNGCYMNGTVEMLNSNNVVCTYLEGAKPWVFNACLKEDNTWNSKRIRQLFYVTKDIIVSGKAYPYQNYQITETILNILKELSEKNLGRTYTYGIEEYCDMKHIGSNCRMENNRFWIAKKDTFKHNIIFDSNVMYNDIFNDHDYTVKYYCYRNKVKKTKIINISGKTCCVKCGDQVSFEYNAFGDYDEDYNERFSRTSSLYCEDCGVICDACGDNYRRTINFKGTELCETCAEHYIKKCPCCGEPFYVKFCDTHLPVVHINEDYFDNIKDTSDLSLVATKRIYMCENCINKQVQDGLLVLREVPKRPNSRWLDHYHKFYLTKEKLNFEDFENHTFYGLEKVDFKKNLYYNI